MSDEEILNEEEQEEMVFPDDYYQYDTENYKSFIQGLPNQIREGYKLGDEINIEGEIKKIVITGMGASSITGDLIKKYIQNPEIQIIVNKNYDLPIEADKETLVIASSYSGNTEETISAYKEAIRKSCKIVIITSGGRLKELGSTNRTQIISLPKGMQPRAAIGYSFFPMLKIMEKLKIIGNKKAEVEKLAKSLDKKIFEETGIKLAEKLVDKIPIIYSSESFSPVVYRWKTQINENSKTFAIGNVFSELNHNELESLKNMNTAFHCIMLRTDIDPHRITKRMEITKEIFRKHKIDVTELALKGDTMLIKLFSLIYMGDWTSYYLALRYKTDPCEVHAIEDFKKALGAYIA